jgi:hypothetical protein
MIQLLGLKGFASDAGKCSASICRQCQYHGWRYSNRTAGSR